MWYAQLHGHLDCWCSREHAMEWLRPHCRAPAQTNSLICHASVPRSAAATQPPSIELSPPTCSRTVAVPAVVVDPDGKSFHMAFDDESAVMVMNGVCPPAPHPTGYPEPRMRAYSFFRSDEPAANAAAEAPTMPPHEGGQHGNAANGSGADSAAANGHGSPSRRQGSVPEPESSPAAPDSRGTNSLVQYVTCNIGFTMLSVADVSDLVARNAAGSDADPAEPSLVQKPALLS